MSTRNKHVVSRAYLLGLTAALAAVPYLQASCPDGSAPLNTVSFHFSGDSYRPGSNCGARFCPDRLLMGGSGIIVGSFCIGQTVTDASVRAQGSFAHFELPPGGTAPGNDIPLQFTGTWKATSVVSFTLLGLLGTDSEGMYPLAAGVLVMNIILVRPSTVAIPLTNVPSLLTLASDLQTWPGVTIPSPALPALSSSPLGPQNGVSLIAPYPGGYSFIPSPVASTLFGGVGTMEAHTPVLFSTLNESRDQPPNP
jgi:hypothetical protein